MWVRALSRALGRARVTRRRSGAAPSDSSVRIGPPVCGSGHRCADPAHSVPISHTSRTVRSEIPRCSPFHTRATKDDVKTAITTSRLPCREGRVRPVSCWARELPLTHPVHDRLKPSRLATARAPPPTRRLRVAHAGFRGGDTRSPIRAPSSALPRTRTRMCRTVSKHMASSIRFGMWTNIDEPQRWMTPFASKT